MKNLETLSVQVGQEAPEAPKITVDGKDLNVKLGEDAVKAHLRSLACDYCREATVRMAEMGLELDWRRPNASDTASMTILPSQLVHDANHDVWHKWNDEARVVKQSIRAQENKVYAELKAKGFRGLKLRDEAKLVIAKLPKIVVPKLPELADSHTKVERPVKVEAKGLRAKGFRSQADEAKAAARSKSVNRTLELLTQIASKR
jgi:hypothetical protein